jgi:hypothetical protein
MIGLQESINGLNEYIGALEGAIGASSFAIAGGIPNPGSRVNGGEISGGTFTTDGGVHSSLGGELIGMNEYIGSSGVLGVSGGALTHGSAEYNNIRGTGVIGAAIGNKLERVKDTVNERVQNVLTLQSILDNTFDNLLSNLDTSGDLAHAADIENVRFVKDKINEALNNETQALQKLLQTTIKPSSDSIKDLVKKNATFAALADSLGVDYDTDEGSDRLAIAYTNLSNTGLAVEKVKHALKTLEMTVNEYSQLRNSKDLEDKLTKILKTVNKPAVKSKLSKILDAIQILRNSQYNHKNVIECIKDDKKCLKTGYGEESSGAFDTHATGAFDIGGENDIDGTFDIGGENDIEGGALTSNSIGRVKKFKTKSTLSRNIKTYEKTLKELFKSFMNQVHTNFKEIQKAVENVADEIGQSITYDEKIKNFVNIFESLGQDTNNNKLFYALIVFDDSIASREIKTRFLTNLDKLIESLDELKQYKYLNEVKRQLGSLKENIDTYTDTVTGFKNNEVKVKEGEKEGSSDFYWTNKILDQSVTLNVSQLIKDTITKLKFYGNVSQMKSSLNSTLNEFVSYKEDYDKLLGKSIGTKINELTTEYNENIDRLENNKCNRGRQLHIYNTDPRNANAQLPKGLVKTIYTLQYEAKLGLYKTIEAIDLYLMNFTELLSSNIEATKELNKMLQQTEVISKWYNKNSADKLFKLMEKVIYNATAGPGNTSVNNVDTFITGQTIKEVLELCKDSIDSVSMLKNMLSMFVHIGDKFGDSKVSSKTYMSPNIMYKNLVKYIWVSAFTMGYGTGGGNPNLANTDTITDPHYTKETGDKASHFNVHFTQLDQNRIQNVDILGHSSTSAATAAATAAAAAAAAARTPTDIFETDDIYFVLVMKAITAKILTVIGTAHILRQPKTVVGLITNPVRSIIGGASKDPEIINDAFELYIRLPLLVEFYKNIFEDGNNPYKKNQRANDATETIAYIPEIGSIWSGLIQCVFDESRYIKDGIYSINNMKRIIAEVNHIYQNYKNVDKNKLVRTAVLDLVADVNKRYGVLKKQEIDEFYQIKKKYVKNPAGSTGANHVNFDILDENNEFEDVGPSSKYTENIYSKSMNEKVLTNDIKLVKEFHNKIHAELFSQKTKLKNLDKKSFTEKIRFYRNELNNTDNKKKLEIIIKAIDDSSNINSHNDDASVLFHELVVAPIKNLQAVYGIIDGMFQRYLPRMRNSVTNVDFVAEYDANSVGATMPAAGTAFNKITLIEFLFSYLSDIDNLVSIKFISKNKFIIDHSKLQHAVETSIENIKYMISKFRSVLSESVIKKYEECLLTLEDLLLFKILNCDDNNDNAKYDLYNFDYLNSSIAIILDDTKDVVLQGNLYKAIMFRQANKSTTANLSTKGANMKIWDDIFAQYGGARNKIWIPIHRLAAAPAAPAPNDFIHLNTLYNNLNNLEDSSILYGFNSLIYEYLCTFYDASTKKIYNNLFNEFVNKSQSSVVFGRKGIPDIYDPTVARTAIPGMPANIGALADSLFIENDYILCESLGYMFKTIVNRTTNVQIPTKNHLLTSLSEVSPNFIEKYKVYLPVFIKLFETLIHKSLLCKKVLETTDTSSTGTDLINIGAPAADTMNPNPRSIEGDLPGDIQSFNTRWAVGRANSKVHFNNTLNSVIEASRAMINDATNVLAEINVKQQFFELKENFIKNYYNNNNTLPLMPLSLNTVILHNNIFQNGPNAPYTLIPYPNKLDNEFKLLYGMNSVINNKALDNSINSYIWLKEELKNYNNSSLSVNKIDVAKVNDYIEMNNKLTISLASIIHYNQFLNETKTNNNFIYINPRVTPPAAPEPCDDTDTYYTQLNAQSVLNEALDSVDNTSLANTKNKISNIIKQSNTTLDISRVNARFLNILDLNIVPLNIHALMREIPLTNIYNYAFTYDHIVKQLFQKDYDYNISNPANCDDILLKLFLNPYYNQCGTPIVKALVSTNDPTTNNSMNNKLGRSKYISDILSHALGAGLNNSAPLGSLSTFNYSDKSRTPPYTENELTKWIDYILSGTNSGQQSSRKRLDNKYLRNLIFLTNLQRLIHYKIKHEVEIINSKVVSDMAITNSQIVNYDDVDHPNLEETDFEYFAED